MQRLHIFALAATSLLFSGISSQAQSAAPAGPYTATCQDVHMKGSTLYANCRTSEGKLAPTRLENPARCADGVINLNGVLNCQAGTIPPGSYLSTCVDPQVQYTTLHASCRNEKGKDISAELQNANRCVGDIANQNGALRCVAPGQSADSSEEKKDAKKKHHLWSLKRDKTDKS